jgi:hypothetical protein
MLSFRAVIVPLVLLITVNPARAVKTKIILAPVKDSSLTNLLPVTAPDARCAVVSDSLGWLAFGHRPTYKKAHVSLFRLDNQGKPASAEPIPLKLPAPAALAKYPNYALDLAFHPKLPLLYVWQDIQLPNPAVPLPAATVKDLDHLLIYSLEKTPPELLLSLCRGPDFGHGKLGGSIAVEPKGGRLYVPNGLNPKDASYARVGSYDLDTDGLPIWSDKSAPKGGTRAVRIAAINAAKSAGKDVLPQRVTPPEATYTAPNNTYGIGWGMIPLARNVLVFGGCYAVITWEPDNRRVQVSTLFLENISKPHPIAAHPTLPVIYASSPDYDFAFRLHHADGYLSLMPQKVSFKGAVLLTPPVVVAKANKVAFGGQNRVFLVGLTKKGDFKEERTQVTVNNPRVEAMAYSLKFDKLYVAVEVSK